MEFGSENVNQQYLNSTQYLFGFKDKDISDLSKTVYFDWSAINNRPLTISSNKIRVNCKATCYGEFRTPLRVSSKAVCSLYLPKSKAKISKHSDVKLLSTIKPRANPKIVDEHYSNNIKRQNGTNYPTNTLANHTASVHRKTNTAESGRVFKPTIALPFPALRVKGNVEEKRGIRPRTGNPKRKELVAEELSKKRFEVRIGTAQMKQSSKGQQASFRMSISQSLDRKRPESRYNKTTLYSKLEHGRANSPEYRVPVLEMKYSEVKTQQVIPECWK